jgi:two-component system, LuxR family, sensor kinase FixL
MSKRSKTARPRSLPHPRPFTSLLTSIVESAPTAIVMIGRDGRIELMNKATEKLFGYGREELLRQPVETLVPERLRSRHPTFRTAFFAVPQARRMGAGRDLFGLRKDGSEFPVEIGLNSIDTEDGLFVLSAIVDITQRQRLEEKLRQSEERFRLLVEEVQDYAIMLLDPQGRIITWNAGAERILGYKAKEIVGQHVSHLFPQEAIDRGEPGHELEVARTQDRCEHEGWRVRKDGSQFWANMIVTALRAEDGILKGFSRITRDLSEQRQVEEGLRAIAAELGRSNTELANFAYIVSHELIEPLRGIAHVASFLIADYHDQFDEDGRAKLLSLQTLSQRMSALTDALVKYSRVGRSQLVLADIDLNRTIREVQDGLRVSIEESRVDIRIPRPLPQIHCERVLAPEVFHNLISNAIKYNDKPDKWVEVGWRAGDHPEDPPVFYVRDNGIGIPQKHLESVFRIFNRLHGRDIYGGGTGAGLTIARKIVERHGGRIWLESEPGKGTTFYFTLGHGVADADST